MDNCTPDQLYTNHNLLHRHAPDTNQSINDITVIVTPIVCFISSGSLERRRDFLDPDFGFKASLNLASRKKSRCKLKTEADSEIPELGLDSGQLNIDCEVNPVRVADAAARVARTYGKYRRDRQRKRAQPLRSGSNMKRKRTRINIDTQYERSRGADEDDDDTAVQYPQQSRDANGVSQDEDDDDD